MTSSPKAPSYKALASMTGFARIEGSGDHGWALEMRSVNGRNLDIKYRFPPGYDIVERLGRDMAKSRFQRGQMNVTLSLSNSGNTTGISLNRDILGVYLAASQELIDAGQALTPSADGLLALRGVIEISGDERPELNEGDEAALAADLARLFEAMTASREGEGQALRMVLKGHLAGIKAAVDKAQALADQQVGLIRERFVRRLDELLTDQQGFEERVLQEAAVLATKADVREELDRLAAHIDQAHQLLDHEAAPGRKLDFLAQEFMREVNTLCSKSAFIELTQVGLELKAFVDQFREQIQNIE